MRVSFFQLALLFGLCAVQLFAVERCDLSVLLRKNAGLTPDSAPIVHPLAVEIPKSKELPPAKLTYRVSESNAAAARFGEVLPRWLLTTNLYWCSGLCLFDRTKNVGLMSHVNPYHLWQNEIPDYVRILKRRFWEEGGDWNAADLTVVTGFYERTETREKLLSILKSINEGRTGTTRIDVTLPEGKRPRRRVIYMDLINGMVSETETGAEPSQEYYRYIDRSKDRSHMPF